MNKSVDKNSGTAAKAHAAIDPVSRKVHNAWLDWLRFFAALEVVLTHARTILFVEYAQLEPQSQTIAVAAWAAMTRLGYEAVIIFFVLSGFLVGGRALELALSRRFSLTDYLIDRVVRIMVPLSGAVVLSVAVASWIGVSLEPAEVVGNWLSLQGAFVDVLPINSPFWTLSYEVWFYVLGGAVAFMLSRRTFSFFAALVLAAAGIIFARLNALYLLLWLGGAASSFYRPRRLSWLETMFGVALLGGGVVTYQLSLPRTFAPEGNALGLVAGGALMLLALALVLPNLRAARWNAGRLAQLGTFLASFSYSLYLIHVPILSASPIKDLRIVSAGAVSVYIAATAIVLIAAFAFSRCFETTGPKLKKWLRGGLRGPQS